MAERKNSLSEYGMRVRMTLFQIGRTQEWLIDEVKKKLPERYVDRSLMYKILTGQVSSPEIINTINEVIALDINDPGEPSGTNEQ